MAPRKPQSGNYPTEDSSERCRGDSELRERGFCIASRPERGQAIWTRNGKRYTEEIARDIASFEAKQQ